MLLQLYGPEMKWFGLPRETCRAAPGSLSGKVWKVNGEEKGAREAKILLYLCVHSFRP